ncbi:11464_t:CDS:2 [Gigaspora margarita]|uniref:11464_t:CDS:1 n=1 Tax=Gigaspora margarita TaxID=4874 RepID=A0ABM8W3V7_GIGMA|nr:11464_t:CDS:2 [Gigaspora margarita]
MDSNDIMNSDSFVNSNDYIIDPNDNDFIDLNDYIMDSNNDLIDSNNDFIALSKSMDTTSIGSSTLEKHNTGLMTNYFNKVAIPLTKIDELHTFFNNLKNFDSEFIDYAKDIINFRAKEFDELIYYLAFFLNLRFYNVSVSKKLTLDNMLVYALTFAKTWIFTCEQAQQISKTLLDYYNNKQLLI